ncbi:hypothetical protein [Deinococcus yavapaiensis]|uniref:Lipoprotein n=1 Tax=Deinococcus yavapaiensis KR-236 TaxID=694435 RepID=A0A318SNA2_9DEIO|nr:hypothetical protein [Deinococcus yavapaiensis]PYE56372.1 hypothetical protein DES52_101176 [Deinococcus yavapaiensis KR-236]
MKNFVAAVGLTALLASCGQYQLQPNVNVGVSTTDATATQVATKTVTPATETAPEKTTWTIGDAGPATFVFSARPGSQGGYITGYRIDRDVVDGDDVTQDPPTTVLKQNVFVPSGFTCTGVNATQSCPITDASTRPANGLPSAPIDLGLASGLGNLVVANDRSVSRSLDITFLGVSSSGAPFEIKVSNIVARGIKAGDE